jgi:hypothetical protein
MREMKFGGKSDLRNNISRALGTVRASSISEGYFSHERDLTDGAVTAN